MITAHIGHRLAVMRFFPDLQRWEESMRRLLLPALAVLVLTGCQSLYDDQAMNDCDATTRVGQARVDCYNWVERNSREHSDREQAWRARP